MSVQQAEPRSSADAVACPRCGAAAEPGQLLCIECGERIALAWRKPPSWRLPAAVIGAVVLFAGIALALALADVAGDAEQVASAPVPTVAAPAPAPAPAPGETAPAPEPAEEAPAPAPKEPAREAGGDLETWPGETSAYTVILVSSEDRAAAERRASAIADAGIPAGVLDSDDYSSLNPGYWVVFAGRFDASEDAEKEAEKYASRGFPGGYPRFVNGGG